LHAKGYDSFVILQWLQAELAENAPPPSCQTVKSCIWCANAFMEILCRANNFMTEPEVANVEVLGSAFMKLYLFLAHRHPKVWRIRPKFHLVWHVVTDPGLRASRHNTSKDSTWMDEDWVKKIGRNMKRCHKRTVQKTALQRYLVALKNKLKVCREKSVCFLRLWPVLVRPPL